MKSIIIVLAILLGGCGGICYQVSPTAYGSRCCYSCVEWPEGTWHRDGKALKGIHKDELCGCKKSCKCWTGYFGGVRDMVE